MEQDTELSRLLKISDAKLSELGSYETVLITLEDHYKASLMSHRCEDLVQLIKNVYTKKKNLEKNGKKTGKTDQQYMKQAKKLLHEELSIALEIPVTEVEDYITRVLEG